MKYKDLIPRYLYRSVWNGCWCSTCVSTIRTSFTFRTGCHLACKLFCDWLLVEKNCYCKREKYGKGEGEHFCHNNFTFSSIGVSAAPVEVLPRSPGTGVPGALPPDDDCLALSFFLFSLTVDRWLLNSFSFLSRFSEFILRILKFRINQLLYVFESRLYLKFALIFQYYYCQLT